jgi:hypothetical protein
MTRKARIVLDVPPVIAAALRLTARRRRVSLKRLLLGRRLDDLGRQRAYTPREARTS